MTPDELLPGIIVRPATPADVDALLALYRNAARWLLARGIDQWRPEQFEREAVLRHIALGEVYVALQAETGKLVGTLALSWADPRIWGEQSPVAGYVHALAVSRSSAGLELGRALLDWAAVQAARAGKTLLRLDCMRDNPGLRAYYERAGFTHVRDLVGRTFSASLYEKRVDGMTTTETIPTRHGTLTIRTAGPEDVDALAAIGESTSAWLESRGIDAGRPPKPLREIAAERVGDGSMDLALLDGRPAGMMTLLWQPEALWADLPGNAAYVHGLLVHRDFAGKEIGCRLLEWAERRASAAGKPLVRLDCTAENPELRAYYERAGYIHRGDVALPHRIAARYEKPVQPAAADLHSPSPRTERGPGGEDNR
ncbi:MAG TPA: GNAT family N-acetyltransferase [Ktedonobacterales bacterium]